MAVALVLGAAVRPDGSASPALSRRVAKAVDLWTEGRVDGIVISGGSVDGRRSEARVAHDLCRAAGVPETALHLETEARSTLGNIRRSRDAITRLGNPRVLIVSDDWHLPRALLCARRFGLEAEGVAADPDDRRAARWKMLAREVPARLWYWLVAWPFLGAYPPRVPETDVPRPPP